MKKIYKNVKGSLLLLLALVSFSVLASESSAPSVPAAPTNVVFTPSASDPTAGNLEWDYTSTVTSATPLFQIVQTVAGGSNVTLTSTKPYTSGTTHYTYSISGLGRGATYGWEVTLTDDPIDGPSPVASAGYYLPVAFGGTMTLRVDDKTQNIGRLYIVEAVDSQDSFEIIYKKSDAAGSWQSVDITGQLSSSPEIGYTLTGLTPDTYYDVQVIAKKAGESDIKSGVVKFKTNRDVPPVANNVTVTGVCPESATISFDFDASQVDEYQLALNGGQIVAFGQGTGTGAVLSGLAPGQSYSFKILSINTTGSTSSQTYYFSTPKYEAPIAASNVSTPYDITENKMTISWTNGDQDFTCYNRVRDSYEILIHIVKADGTIEERQGGTHGTSTSYTVENLAPKSTVTITVAALNSLHGFLSRSTPVTGVTLGPPLAPSDLKATCDKDIFGDSEINLSWTDNSDDEDGFTFQIQRTDGTFKELAKIKADLVGLVHKTIQEGANYTYRIAAFNEYGTSDFSNELTFACENTDAAETVGVTVFPNPTVNMVNLKVSKETTTGTYSLVNQNNRSVLSRSVNFVNGEAAIDISGVSPGAYQLIIKTDDYQVSKKIFKY